MRYTTTSGDKAFLAGAVAIIAAFTVDAFWAVFAMLFFAVGVADLLYGRSVARRQERKHSEDH